MKIYILLLSMLLVQGCRISSYKKKLNNIQSCYLECNIIKCDPKLENCDLDSITFKRLSQFPRERKINNNLLIVKLNNSIDVYNLICDTLIKNENIINPQIRTNKYLIVNAQNVNALKVRDRLFDYAESLKPCCLNLPRAKAYKRFLKNF